VSDIAIRASGASKRFRLYRRRRQSLKEVLVNRSRGEWQELWALRDASFVVHRGEVVGIIGENGSGKSTTLKLLAGILFVDEGSIETHGRVSSLLELGAGFQGEYTGRENIFLYGALLGLSRRDIQQKFDQIVEFSELGPFIEYPVKNYSSGMYMRLGFAVAVHLDPEILLVDEVLAVGDAHFQQKCFDHMEALREANTTIVLVSHDLDSVRRFCGRAIWLDHGHVAADGPSGETTERYLDAVAGQPTLATGAGVEVPGFGRLTGEVQILSVRLLGEGGRETRSLFPEEPLEIEIRYRSERGGQRLQVILHVFRSNDGLLCTEANSVDDYFDALLPPGEGFITLRYPRLSLSSGTYDISILLLDRDTGRMHDYHEHRHPFTIRGGNALVSLEREWAVRPTDRATIRD
jgi:lipopolysaccharide transport system ATP-binding protein